jgi:hypothetical protein
VITLGGREGERDGKRVRPASDPKKRVRAAAAALTQREKGNRLVDDWPLDGRALHERVSLDVWLLYQRVAFLDRWALHQAVTFDVLVRGRRCVLFLHNSSFRRQTGSGVFSL